MRKTVYSLPSLTIGCAQVLDIGLVSVFNKTLINIIEDISYFDKKNNFDLSYFLSIIRWEYDITFISWSINRAYQKTSIHPLNHARLVTAPGPQSQQFQITLATADDIIILVDKKTTLHNSVTLLSVVFFRGFFEVMVNFSHSARYLRPLHRNMASVDANAYKEKSKCGAEAARSDETKFRLGSSPSPWQGKAAFQRRVIL